MANKRNSNVWIQTNSIGNIQEFLVFLSTIRYATTTSLDDAYVGNELPINMQNMVPDIFKKVPITIVETRSLVEIPEPPKDLSIKQKIALFTEEAFSMREKSISASTIADKQALLLQALSFDRQADELRSSLSNLRGPVFKFKNLHPKAKFCAMDATGRWLAYSAKPIINPLGGSPYQWECLSDGKLRFLEFIRPDQKTDAFFDNPISPENWEFSLYEVSPEECQSWQNLN